MTHQAIVLVSGGMDSIAAACWAKPRYRDILALLFDYGQPNRDMELPLAGKLLDEMSIRWLSYLMTESFSTAGLLREVQDHDGREDGLSPAIVPGRNLEFCVRAAIRAVEHFPNGNIDLIIGCNAQDAKRFPDCHLAALQPLAQALRAGMAREIRIQTPWFNKTKTEILWSLSEADRDRVARSWSCYRHGEAPCGKCSACVLRAEAFTAVGLEDQAKPVPLHGGDPVRCR